MLRKLFHTVIFVIATMIVIAMLLMSGSFFIMSLVMKIVYPFGCLFVVFAFFYFLLRSILTLD
jgi:hypothetical protein